jgi:hypothetical protein
MGITITITEDTVWDAQNAMAQLLAGRQTASTSGSVPAAIAPVAPIPPVASPPISDTAPSIESTPLNTPTASTELQPEPSSGSTEQPKRGRGRPRKDANSVAADPATATSEAADEGNAPSGEASATETVEPTSDAASSTSSESATEEVVTETAEQPAVTDADLQRFCAKLAEKFGGPQKVFDACKPFLAEGDVARPTNIRRTEDRWAFIRGMEIESGLTFHG